MKRPISFTAQAVVAVAALLVADAVAAAGSSSASDSSKRTTNSFNVLYTAATPNAPVILPSNGTGPAPAKAVVTNPYAVPLFQNAGALRPGR